LTLYTNSSLFRVFFQSHSLSHPGTLPETPGPALKRCQHCILNNLDLIEMSHDNHILGASKHRSLVKRGRETVAEHLFAFTAASLVVSIICLADAVAAMAKIRHS
jgi:hypothetical protein